MSSRLLHQHDHVYIFFTPQHLSKLVTLCLMSMKPRARSENPSTSFKSGKGLRVARGIPCGNGNAKHFRTAIVMAVDANYPWRRVIWQRSDKYLVFVNGNNPRQINLWEPSSCCSGCPESKGVSLCPPELNLEHSSWHETEFSSKHRALPLWFLDGFRPFSWKFNALWWQDLQCQSKWSLDGFFSSSIRNTRIWKKTRFLFVSQDRTQTCWACCIFFHGRPDAPSQPLCIRSLSEAKQLRSRKSRRAAHLATFVESASWRVILSKFFGWKHVFLASFISV